MFVPISPSVALRALSLLGEISFRQVCYFARLLLGEILNFAKYVTPLVCFFVFLFVCERSLGHNP